MHTNARTCKKLQPNIKSSLWFEGTRIYIKSIHCTSTPYLHIVGMDASFQGHNIMHLIASPIMFNGLPSSTFGKDKDALAIKLKLTMTSKVFVSIGLLWWRIIPPPKLTKLPYAKAFLLLVSLGWWPDLACITKHM